MCSIGVPDNTFLRSLQRLRGVSPSHPRAPQMWGTNRRAVPRGGGRCSCSHPPSRPHRPAQTFLPSTSGQFFSKIVSSQLSGYEPHESQINYGLSIFLVQIGTGMSESDVLPLPRFWHLMLSPGARHFFHFSVIFQELSVFIGRDDDVAGSGTGGAGRPPFRVPGPSLACT